MTVKKSLPMRLAELCRAERITGVAAPGRNLKAERSAMRRRMRELERQGKAEQVGGRYGPWRAIYALAAVAVLLALAGPVAAQQSPQSTFRDSGGRVVGTSTIDTGGTTTFRDAGGRTTGTASRDGQGTVTFRDSGGRTTGSMSGGRR